jgi:hypothetical protein
MRSTAPQPAQYGPVIDARRATLVKNGLGGLASPSGVASCIVQRRAYIQTPIAANDVAQLAITSNNGNNFTSTTPTATLTGRAPFAVANVTVNGTVYPATWTDQNSFSVAVPLTAAANPFTLAGMDRNGNPIAGATATITVNYAGAIQQPKDYVVINEIHYNPAESGASFVELFNNSTTTLFDLSGDRPRRAWATPSPTAPSSRPVATSCWRRAAPSARRTAARSRYSPSSPARSTTAARRSRRPAPRSRRHQRPRDQRRPLRQPPALAHQCGRLRAVPAARRSEPRQLPRGQLGSRRHQLGGSRHPGPRQLGQGRHPGLPSLWLNEVSNNITGPVDNAGEHDPFIELYNGGATGIVLGAYALTDDYNNLAKWRFPAGFSIAPGQFLVVWADGQAARSTDTILHTSFRAWNPTNSGLALTRVLGTTTNVMDYLDYKQLPADRSFGSYPDGEPHGRRSFYHVTAGATNDPVFPAIKVTINEFMADNTSTIFNPVGGKADDWFELFNGGDSAVDLHQLPAHGEPHELNQFTVPPGYVIPAGGFLLVWADNNAKANSPTNAALHVNFKLAKAGQQLGLFSPDGNLVDGFTFGAQTNDISQGRYPDGGEPPCSSSPRRLPASRTSWPAPTCRRPWPRSRHRRSMNRRR